MRSAIVPTTPLPRTPVFNFPTANSNMLAPILSKNDRRARVLIFGLSIIVFVAVVILERVQLTVDPGFDVHAFALINAVINSTVSILLIGGMIAIRQRAFVAHKRMMLAAIVLSALFLVSYIAHHLLAGDSKLGDVNGDGLVSAAEKAAVGARRYIYYVLLITHILLAAIILPFILYTAYRALTGEYEKHKKLARFTWPLWLYVSVSGVVVYLFISPYYH